MGIVETKSICQLAAMPLGRGKGCKGRKSNKQKRKEHADEMGLMSVAEFLKKKSAKGNNEDPQLECQGPTEYQGLIGT